MDNKFRVPRVWSNSELKKFSSLFSGKIVNVSGWQDADKQGKKYKEYFQNASEYWITNYKAEARGFQGDLENEIFLDLTQEVEQILCEKFDVVFNHTVLEHVFELDIAFANLCKLTKDIAIIVVPFLQEQHAAYGDFWRFSPQAIDKLFLKNELQTIYINFNDTKNASVYVFAIGSKHPNKWVDIINNQDNKIHIIDNYNIGTKIIKINAADYFRLLLRKIYSKFFRNHDKL